MLCNNKENLLSSIKTIVLQSIKNVLFDKHWIYFIELNVCKPATNKRWFVRANEAYHQPLLIDLPLSLR